jgi:hypothetical protein
MAPSKPQQSIRAVAFVQWMGLVFLSGLMWFYRKLRPNPRRKTFVFINNSPERNLLETMKVILASAGCSDSAHPLPGGILGRKSARQLSNQ